MMAAAAAPWLVRTCGDAGPDSAAGGGRSVDSNRGAAKPQAELEVCPPPSLFLSPHRTRGKWLPRWISRAKTLFGRTSVDFPQGHGLLAPTTPCAAYLAPARSISRKINWGAVDFTRCGRLAARPTYFLWAHGLLAPSLPILASGVRGVAVGVRPTPHDS